MDRSIHLRQNENLRRRSSSPLSSPPSSDDDQVAPVKTTTQQPKSALNQATPDATVLQTPRSSRTPQQVESNRVINRVSSQYEPGHTTLWQENPVRYREAPKEPLFPESNICTPPHGTDMATMTMHAAPGHTPAAWDERSNMERVGSRTRSQEFASDAMTLPPIRQAVPELDMRPVSEAPRYRTESVVPTIEGEGSSPTFYSPGERQRREERYAQSQYAGAPVYQQQPMYRPAPYQEYSQSQYPEPQYDQRVPGYGRPQYAQQEYADPRARVMVQQPAYAPSYHPAEYRHSQHEVYQQHMGIPQQNGDGGKGGPQRKRRGNLPKETTDKLRSWFHGHLHHPYPTEDEKQELMMMTGLQMNQISNWFINARRRQLPQLLNDKANAGTPGSKGGVNASSSALSYAQKGVGRRYDDDDDDSEDSEDEDMEDYNDARHGSAKKNGKL